VFTTSKTYSWSFVTQIFHNGQPSHGDRKTFDVMTSTKPRGTLGSVASVLTAILYQGNPDRMIGTTSSRISYQLRDIYPIRRCCWNNATYEWKVHNGKMEIFSFVVSFLTAPHCQFLGVDKGMKQTYLYLWYPLFQNICLLYTLHKYSSL
jgi:hypothetical protein